MLLELTKTSGQGIALNLDKIWKVEETDYGCIVSAGTKTMALSTSYADVLTDGSSALQEFTIGDNTLALNVNFIDSTFPFIAGGSAIVLNNGNVVYVNEDVADIVADQPVSGGGSYQPLDATLTALAALTIAADSITIGTGADAFSQTTFAANTFPAKGSTGNLVAKTITDFGLSLVDDTDASAARTTLGLGTLATQNGTFSGSSSGTNTGDQTNITGNAGTVTVADAGGDTTTWVLLGTAQTGSLAPATDAGLTYNATTNALTASTFIGALTGNADTVTGFSGTSSGTNTGDQTITNSSDATSHTVTLSATGGSVQLVEGSGITLTTTGTGSAGIVTIAASGGGDISNGGNTTGAAVTIGTNDDFGLNLETSGVTRMAITGDASTGGAVTITNVTTNTNTVQDVLTLRTNSTGTAAASFGGGILFQGESSTTDNQDMVRLSAIWTTAIHASRASALVYSDVTGAGSLTERFRFTPTTMTTATSYTIGNSANALTLGGSSGTVLLSTSAGGTGALTLSSTGTAANTIRFTASDNAATSTAGINFGNAVSFTQTSNTKNYINHDAGFAPTSGTAVHNSLVFSGTFNQTGGANGITRAIYLNQTLTAVADFRGIEIAYSNASAKGIYQTGSSTTNNFVGKTRFGGTTTPDDALEVEGNIELVTAGNKLKIATGSNASVGTSGNMTAGSITISTTAVTANSIIFLQHNTPGGTQGILSYGTIIVGTSFVITSSNAADTSTVNWWILN